MAFCWKENPSCGNIFLNFLFYIGVELINNVVPVSGGQQNDSVIHIHVPILFQILSPIRLLHNIEQSYIIIGCLRFLETSMWCSQNIFNMTTSISQNVLPIHSYQEDFWHLLSISIYFIIYILYTHIIHTTVHVYIYIFITF